MPSRRRREGRARLHDLHDIEQVSDSLQIPERSKEPLVSKLRLVCQRRSAYSSLGHQEAWTFWDEPREVSAIYHSLRSSRTYQIRQTCITGANACTSEGIRHDQEEPSALWNAPKHTQAAAKGESVSRLPAHMTIGRATHQQYSRSTTTHCTWKSAFHAIRPDQELSPLHSVPA